MAFVASSCGPRALADAHPHDLRASIHTAADGYTTTRRATGVRVDVGGHSGLAIVGFARTYLLVPALGRPADTLPATPLVHLHAATFFAWCVLMLAPSCLVAGGSVARLGRPREELAFLAVSLGNVVAYTAALGAAFVWRRNPAADKRLMMIGMVALLTAPFGRLLDLPYQLAHVVGPGLVVVALAVWDRRAYGRLHPVTLWLGPAILAWELAPNAYMFSPWWLHVANRLVDLTG